MKLVFTIIILNIIILTPIFGQVKNNINVQGVSIEFGPSFSEPKKVNTNGIKLEIIGDGILVAFLPRSPIDTNKVAFDSLKTTPFSERVNGMVISASGTFCDGKINGFCIGTVGHINRQVNGISIAGMMNFTQILNGVQFAAHINDIYQMNGVQIGGLILNGAQEMNGVQLGVNNKANKARGMQIGLVNKSKHLRGIQIGLWNVNQERKMPILNWSFEKRKTSKAKFRPLSI